MKRAPTGHPLVKPVVNGQDTGWFIFDTGAGIGCVSTPHVESLVLVLDYGGERMALREREAAR